MKYTTVSKVRFAIDGSATTYYSPAVSSTAAKLVLLEESLKGC
jgi:hypothetical protein